jgi:hypothetical protein
MNNENITKKTVYYDVRKEPFKVYGLYDYKSAGKFKRFPESVAQNSSDSLVNLNYNTAGARVRFKTDSNYICLNVKMDSLAYMPYMPLTGSSGFDLYINNNGQSLYYRTFIPPINMNGGYESVIYFNDCNEKDIIINFPLYNSVNDLFIGIDEKSHIISGSEYRIKTPLLFYGSSITQGGCASRPGNSYPSIISRDFDCDYINLGFSGSARAEDAIVEYMSTLNVSLFICDYDYNAPDPDYLKATHEKVYNKMRSKNKNLPIILISKPDFDSDEEPSNLRRNVVYTTFMNAINNGDKNVYFIDGQGLFNGEGKDGCTVDGCHPNDLGFFRMAKTIGFTIKKILYKS